MTPEFSRPERLDQLGATKQVIIAADPGERIALAARFGLIAIDRLEATAALEREGDRVMVGGRLRATVVQACVATGERVAAEIDTPFTMRLVPAGSNAAADEVELSEDQLDEVEYDGGAIDLGEAVAQTLALALDPFPRVPDADERLRAAGVVDEGEVGPFAALRDLRDRLQLDQRSRT